MKLLTIDAKSPNAAEQLVNSFKHTGFAVIENHPIEPWQFDQVYKEWADFFASQQKYQYPHDVQSQDGYVSQALSEVAKGNDVKDIKEFFDIYPQGRYPASLSMNTSQLLLEMTAFAKELLSWLQQATPDSVKSKFSMPLPDMVEGSDNILLRVIHYPPLTGDEEPGSVRGAAHEDINLITLLPTATTSGLQVKTLQGGWINVVAKPGSLIINAGDMLQLCSGGYYPSTSHRVINPNADVPNVSRYATPCFVHPRNEVMLAGNVTRYDYFMERMMELGLVY